MKDYWVDYKLSSFKVLRNNVPYCLTGSILNSAFNSEEAVKKALELFGDIVDEITAVYLAK